MKMQFVCLITSIAVFCMFLECSSEVNASLEVNPNLTVGRSDLGRDYYVGSIDPKYQPNPRQMKRCYINVVDCYVAAGE